MSNCRELITIQFGHYSNYVGAHFWNIQELSFDYTGEKKSTINHDVLYREGLINNKATYTPRLLLADLRGALGSLPIGGGLSQESHETFVCDEFNIEREEEPAVEKNDYLKYINNELDPEVSIENFDFEKNIKTWTDFLFPRFNQRTVSIINEYRFNDEQVPFEIYHMGVNTWKKEQFSEDFADNIRKYSEECDNFQGFQILLDSTDGFGGLANGCLQYLNDEYSNKSTFVVPLIPGYFPDNDPSNQKERDISNMKDSTRLVNLLLTYEGLWENSSLFVPMSCGEKGWRKPGVQREFFNLNYNSKLDYHSSAIIASALDTLSISYRQNNSSLILSDMCTDMSGYGRKMAAASLGLPFYIKEENELIECLDKSNSKLFTSITPNCEIGNEKIFQYIHVRGIPETKLKKPLNKSDEQIKMAAYRCESVKEMFELYFQCNNYASATNVNTSIDGMEIKMPFPKIFSKDLNTEGYVKQFENDNIEVEKVPVIAGLHNGNFLFHTFENISREAKRIKIQKLHKFTQEGLEIDDYSECLNKISEMQSNYEDFYEL